MKQKTANNWVILPCCLLVLNLVNQVIGYKADDWVPDPLIRTIVVMLLVLFGASAVAYLVSPALELFFRSVWRSSRSTAGMVGEALAVVGFAAFVFWLYYRLATYGVPGLIPGALAVAPR